MQPSNLIQIVSYRTLFGENPPQNRLELINNLDIVFIIDRISGLNQQLLKFSDNFDYSIETQMKCLFHFSGNDRFIYNKYLSHLDIFLRNKIEFIIFSRASCLYALEELKINYHNLSKNKTSTEFTDKQAKEQILRYLLTINDFVARKPESHIEEGTILDNLPGYAPINEHMFGQMGYLMLYRGNKFVSLLDAKDKLNGQLEQYISNIFGLEFHRICLMIMQMYNYYHRISSSPRFSIRFENVLDMQFLNALSHTTQETEPERLINIKKYPFIKVSEEDFYLLDSQFFFRKFCSQLINDFWFDYVKPKNILSAKVYRSYVGRVFEAYIEEYFRYVIPNKKHYKLLLFDELKYGKEEKEFIDVYFRYNDNVYLAEVKGASIYDNEKYSRDEGFYRNDPKQFFKDFGITQLVNALENYEIVPKHFDKRESKHITIYPSIIIQDDLFLFSYLENLLQQEFSDKISTLKLNGIEVKPLTLIHVSDLEMMEYVIHKHPNKLWYILKRYTKVSNPKMTFNIFLSRLLRKKDYLFKTSKRVVEFLQFGDRK